MTTLSRVFVTNHGEDSMRSRLKTSKNRTNAHSLEAIKKGIPREDIGGDLRRYIDRKYFMHDSKARIVLWRNFLWIFVDVDVLVTCYPLPGNLNKDACHQFKKWRKKNDPAK